MADHDRDAGSRGEEETPRDPGSREHTPTGPARDGGTAAHPTPYGDFGPGPYSGPGWDPPPPPPAKSAFGDFLTRKRTQIAGAGLAGLVLGGIIGGGAVALAGVVWDRPHPAGERPHYWDRPDRFERPWGECYQRGDRLICDVEPEPLRTSIS